MTDRIMKPVVAILAAAFGLTSSATQSIEVSLPKPREAWIEIQTANFRFFSNAGRVATRRVAVDLEELRAVLAQLTDYDLQAPVPTFIYVFKGERSFLPYKILYQDRPATVSGYFIGADGANYIAINADAQDASGVVYHEYVHYVANNNMWYLPLWFSEGLAEFYEGFHVSGDTVYIGTPVVRHLLVLQRARLIPVGDLFEVDGTSELYNEARRKEVFYAQSWAMVHYLLLGNQDRRQQLGRYLEMVRNGIPSRDAFLDAFSTDFETLEKELRAYLRSLRFPWIEVKAEIDLDKNLEIRRMSYADVLFRLGDLLANQTPARAERRAHFEAAVESDPRHGPAISSLAIEAEHLADWDTAHSLHERASEATPEDALVLYRWGKFLSRRSGYYEQAAAILTRSTDLDPSFAPAWSALSQVYADAGVTSDRAVVAARTAHEMRPADMATARDLLQLYMRLDQRQDAITLIEDSMRSNRRVYAQAWLLVIQQDLARARELLKNGRRQEAARRIELTEEIVGHSPNPDAARESIESIRQSIAEHEAALLYNRAQQFFSRDDREGARGLLLQALSLTNEGPVSSSCRQLLMIIDHPERLITTPESTFEASPTVTEIDHLNELIESRDFETAVEFLKELRPRVNAENQAWIDRRIQGIQRTLDYNRFVDDYNRAVDHYNQKQYGEAVRILRELLATLPDGQESASAKALLHDALEAQR